jgi:hypothetical protein
MLDEWSLWIEQFQPAVFAGMLILLCCALLFFGTTSASKKTC